MPTTLKILIVEDNESDADLLQRELKKTDLSFIAQVVQTRLSFEQALNSFVPDIILSDYSLPAFDAVTAFQIKQQHHPLTPFIIISGVIGEENAVNLIKSGVTDYVSKSKLITLHTKITRALNDLEARKEKIITSNRLKTLNLELLSLNEELENRVAKRTKALAESESRFRSMMETIPQIAWTNTAKGEIVFYNQRWYDYTGLTKEETKSLGFKAVVHPEDLKMISKRFNAPLPAKEASEFQIRIKRADGVYRWHLIRLVPIVDAQSETQLSVGTATDIQELRLLQQYKDDFIIIASHEIKTPITSLKASLQMLDRIKHKPQSNQSSKLIDQANRSLVKVTTLIDDLLSASMANQGQLNIKREKLNLYQAIASCAADLHIDNSFTIETEGDDSITVFADSIRIEQVVSNFITNAVKYAPDSKKIRIRIEKIDGMAKVSVIDAGKGIPAEKIQFLFDRFFQVVTSETQYTGLGLGLYICSEIIKNHGGDIGAESELGVGSTFWFTLPIA